MTPPPPLPRLPPLSRLPIDPLLPEVIRTLEKDSCLVLQASPGSGKTTRVPPALLDAFGSRGEILVLEPRRLAAKYAARRVAEERGESVGQTVGYHFRFENVGGPATRLRFLTEGMLMRRLLGDPSLNGVRAVILDEFHERHLHGDIALGYLSWLRRQRPELKLVVMSATLDTGAIAGFLGGAPTLKIDAAPFAVTQEYLSAPSEKPLEVLVRDAVRAEISRKESDGGDILVFLPGMGEIRRAEAQLEPLAGAHGFVVRPLHGELSKDEQDRAIQRGDRRKVILSTNVAETSLTIEGITVVIDSGLHRIASYSWWSGVPALRTRPISRASAIQRAGRAGRTAPGRCLRLYTKGDFDARPPFDTPEIRRADMAQTLLELKALGVADPAAFPWFEAPSAQSLEASLKLLFRLGALDSTGELTAIGKRMAELPAHPRIGRLLIEAQKLGVLEPAALLAACLSEGRLERLDAMEMLASGRADESVRRTQRQWLAYFRGAPVAAAADREKVAFAFLTGFPDRVARKRAGSRSVARLKSGETEVLFSSGGSAKVEEAGVVADGSVFVALDTQERQGLGQARAQLKVSSLLLVREEWLFDLEPSAVREEEALSWDAAAGAVVATSRLAYDELILAESKASPKPSEAATRILLRGALGLDPEKLSGMSLVDWIAALGKLGNGGEIEAALARALLYRKYFPEQVNGVDPDPSSAFTHLFDGKFTTRELRETDWTGACLQALTGQPAQRLEPLLPSHFTLPGGRRLIVHYHLDKPPWAESRLQDFFGMKQGPALLGGRLPLTLHLLAPNHRAVQVTSDLAGFWERAYPAIRKDLSRKYPRHSWPESPLQAQPPPPKGRR